MLYNVLRLRWKFRNFRYRLRSYIAKVERSSSRLWSQMYEGDKNERDRTGSMVASYNCFCGDYVELQDNGIILYRGCFLRPRMTVFEPK